MLSVSEDRKSLYILQKSTVGPAKTDTTENTQPTTTQMPVEKSSRKADAENNKENISNGWSCNGTICTDTSSVEESGTEPKVDSSLSDEVITSLEETTGWTCNGTSCIDLGPKYNIETSNQGNYIHLYCVLAITFKISKFIFRILRLYIYFFVCAFINRGSP